MVDARRLFGNMGEQLAAQYLQSKGYKIIEQQYKTIYGEIDLICHQGDEVVFVEVKSRRDDSFGYPEDSVDERKIRHLLNSAQNYLDTIGEDVSWRIDVISVEFIEETPRFHHFEAIDIPESLW